MALIIEDGTGVATADSFVSLADARTFAANYGLILPTDDTEAEVKLRQGYLNLLTNERLLQGSRSTETQNNIYPRTGVYDNCKLVDDDVIPESVKNAQVYAADSINSGTSTNGSSTGQNLKSFSVDGVYSESYQDGSSQSTNATIQGVYNSLYPLTKAGFNSSPCGPNGGNGGLVRDDYFYDGRGIC